MRILTSKEEGPKGKGPKEKGERKKEEGAFPFYLCSFDLDRVLDSYLSRIMIA